MSYYRSTLTASWWSHTRAILLPQCPAPCTLLASLLSAIQLACQKVKRDTSSESKSLVDPRPSGPFLCISSHFIWLKVPISSTKINIFISAGQADDAMDVWVILYQSAPSSEEESETKQANPYYILSHYQRVFSSYRLLIQCKLLHNKAPFS